MIKFGKVHIIAFSFLFLLSHSLMGMEVNVKEEAFFNQEFPTAVVPGKIVFQSNRNGTPSEIWVLESGQIKKVAFGKNAGKDMRKQLPELYSGMLGSVLSDLRKPKWSPDGNSILCLSDEKLVLLNLDGTIQTEIKSAKPPYNANWSPDGKSIYYSTADRLPKGGGADNIYRLNLAEKTEQKITDMPPSPGVSPILSFAISPNGKQIAMTVVGDQAISIWIVNADGSDLKEFVKYAREPAWSPDGEKMAYASHFSSTGEKITEQHEIFILDLKTMQKTQLTHNGWADREPIFSPDGTKIAFKSARHRIISHGSEIFVINVDGTGEARLTPAKQNLQYSNDSYRGWATDQYPDWHA